jgi:aspartyl-tRNA synthetase
LLLYVDFPLLEFDEESGRYHACTILSPPKPEDMHLLATDPKVRAMPMIWY